MRRRDLERDKAFGYKAIDDAEFLVASMLDSDGKPYGVPLSFVRIDDAIYCHCARQGKKMACITMKPNVHLSFVGSVKRATPVTQEQIEEARMDDTLGPLMGRTFTTGYQSAMVWGEVQIIEDLEEKRLALKAISEKYVPESMDYFDLGLGGMLQSTAVIRIEIQELSAKGHHI